MKGDGDGWAAGPQGTAMWGRNGAAGLLLIATDQNGGKQVLMQHRAPWTNNGGTWALPGGARDSHETVEDAALREAVEETGINPADVVLFHAYTTSGPFPADPKRPELAGGWSYSTVIARVAGGLALPLTPNEESLELRWVPIEEVAALPLMPAFARTWEFLSVEVAKAPSMTDW